MSHLGADSAGQPWMGRTLTPGGFPDDDGAADSALEAALTVLAPPASPPSGPVPSQDPRATTDRLVDVVAALGAARLLVPVVAVAGEQASADMALPRLRTPDGRTALPVFSCTAAMAAWDPAARPVPVAGRRAALSAVDDGCDVMVLDPAGPAVVVPRPAVWAVAQGRAWTPSPRDADVHAAVAAAARAVRRDHPALRGARCEPGERTELRVVLDLLPGLDAAAVRSLSEAVQGALAASAVVAERVDSVELRLVAAPDPPHRGIG